MPNDNLPGRENGPAKAAWRFFAAAFMIDMVVWAGNPHRTATCPRSVRNELAKKFSNQTPSRLKRCMLGITGSPFTVSSMIVRPKLSSRISTTFGRSLRSSRGVPASAPGRLPRNSSKKSLPPLLFEERISLGIVLIVPRPRRETKKRGSSQRGSGTCSS